MIWEFFFITVFSIENKFALKTFFNLIWHYYLKPFFTYFLLFCVEILVLFSINSACVFIALSTISYVDMNSNQTTFKGY